MEPKRSYEEFSSELSTSFLKIKTNVVDTMNTQPQKKTKPKLSYQTINQMLP